MSKPYFFDIEKDYSKIGNTIKKTGLKRIFIVCGSSFDKTKLKDYFELLRKNENIELVRFSGYESNPDISSVSAAKELFMNERCQGIIAVGGGSATDLSKCLRLALCMEKDFNYSYPVPFFVIPTIAGSGSEVTRFAVIYSGQEKLSVSHNICFPEVVFYDSSLMETLPLYQRISTLLDAFCHSIESLWSVNSTSASILYAESALLLLLKHKEQYLSNSPVGNKEFQKAAMYAGMAINISQTTAAHAMSYRLTKLYNIPHGISAGLCLEQVWKYFLKNKAQYLDIRGKEHLKLIFEIICQSFGSDNIENALQIYIKMLRSFNLPKLNSKDSYVSTLLANSVNTERLNNFPLPLSEPELKAMYEALIA